MPLHRQITYIVPYRNSIMLKSNYPTTIEVCRDLLYENDAKIVYTFCAAKTER